jgi:imidazolonepropionase-like amidohydrolase
LQEVPVIRQKLPVRLLTLGALLALVPFAAIHVKGQAQTAAQAGIVALRGGTVLTVTKGTIENGTVILRDGKIAAVGANLSIPAGAQIVDTTGQFVTPGLIDAHSHIANDAINEGGTTVSSMTGMEDVLDPTDINIYRDLAGGLTTANVLHGSANPIGGKNQVIKLKWGKLRADEIKFEGAMPGIKFALGENPKDMQTGGAAQTGPRRYPATRLGVEFVIRDAFTRAKAYQKAWRDYEAKKKSNADVLPPRRDLQLEPLVEILEGKRLVHAHCYRADEILMMIRLAEEMGFKIATFQHVLEGYMVAKEMAAHGAGGSTFSDWWAYKVEAADAIPHNAAIMTRKGVLVSINSDSAEHARRLNTEAAKTMKWGGLSEDEALATVTINPAKQLRIDSRVGSLEPGKDADVTVWNRHPLSTYAIAERVYIDGAVYYDRRAEEGRLTALRKEKSTLAAAEQTGTRPSSSNPPQEPPKAGDVKNDPPKAGDVKNDPPKTGDVKNEPPVDRTSGGPRVTESQPTGTSGAAVQAKPAAGPVIAITNAVIHPITRPDIERGTIVLRGSRIEALGANVTVPAGAKVIDAAGAHVYPGFINARTQMGLNEPGPRGFEDVNEMLDINPQLRTRVAYHAESDAIAVARGNGITTVAVMPGGGTFGGEVAVMNLDGWTWEEATLKANAGITFNFPVLGGGGGRGGRGGGGGGAEGATFDDLRRTRDRRLDEIARLLDRARAYAKAGPDKTVDWTLEALVPVVERKLPLIATVNRTQDVRDAIAFAERVKVNLVVSGALDAAAAAPLLKEKNVPVILGNVLSLPASEDAFHAATYQLAGELSQAGVKVAFATGDSAYVRIVPYHAAMSVAWGMNRDEALKALTINAAEILGVADRVGSLEPGKDANLFIAKGDPLEIRTAVTNVIIAGKEVGTDNKHERLYQKYIARP